MVVYFMRKERMRDEYKVIDALLDDNVFDEITKVGSIIKEERVKRNLTVTELAEKAKINMTHLYRIENNEKPIGLKALLCVAKALNCSIDSLFPYQRYLNKKINPNLEEDVLCVEYCSKENLNEWYRNVIKKIGNNIKEERENQKISLDYLGNLLKINCEELLLIENGEKAITLSELLGISMVLNRKIETLLQFDKCKETFIVLKKEKDIVECENNSCKIDEIICKIGGIIKKEREIQGITVSQFSERTNINKTHLYRIESGARPVGLKALIKVAIVLNKPLSFFIADDVD